MKKWLVLFGLTACVPQTRSTIEEPKRAPDPPVPHAEEKPEKRTLPFHCGDDLVVADRQFIVEARVTSKSSGPGGYMAGVNGPSETHQKWLARVVGASADLDLQVIERKEGEDTSADVAAPSIQPWPIQSRKELSQPFSDLIGAVNDETQPMSVRLTPSKAKTPYENAKVMDVVANGTSYGAGLGHRARTEVRSKGTMTFTSGGVLLDAQLETTESTWEWTSFDCPRGVACPEQHTRTLVTKLAYHVVCEP